MPKYEVKVICTFHVEAEVPETVLKTIPLLIHISRGPEAVAHITDAQTKELVLVAKLPDKEAT
jgi:hypothetical protein